MKPRVRVKMGWRMIGRGMPDDARPGDLVVGNRGAAARVAVNERNSCLYLEYAGNYYDGILQPASGRKLHDQR